MADTLRIRKKLSRTPEVAALVAASGLSRLEVVGLLVEFWAWADDEGDSGTIELNGLLGSVPGYLSCVIGGNEAFWLEMRKVDWLRFDLSTIELPNYERYAEPEMDVEEQDGLFRMFWTTYPIKEGKAAALKAWRKIKLTNELMSQIMSALERQKNSQRWRDEGGKYIPHASTWLNGKRWEDEGRERPVARSGREIVIPGKYAKAAAKRQTQVVQTEPTLPPKQGERQG